MGPLDAAPRACPAGGNCSLLGQVEASVREFGELPRSGETVYGFVAGLYPSDQPVLPTPTRPAAE